MVMKQIDNSIIEMAQRGEVSAFEKILTFYERSVFAYSLRLVRDRLDAEDITQDVFIKLYKNIKRFNFKYKFTTWLFTITKNTINDFFRKKSRRREILIFDCEGQKAETFLEKFTTTRFDVKKNLKIDLDRALLVVRPVYSKIITLFYEEGLAYKEISEKLMIPINTVKTYIYRAKKDLAKELV